MRRNALFWPALLLALLCACGGPAETVAGPGGTVNNPREGQAANGVITLVMTAERAAQAVLDSQPETDGLARIRGEELSAYLTGQFGLEEQTWTDAALHAAFGVDARTVVVLCTPTQAGGEAAAAALEEYRQRRLGDFFGYAPEQAALLEEALVLRQGEYTALLVCTDMDAAVQAFEDCLEGESVTALAPAAPTPTLDVSSFVPFDPPNEYDMTVYDNSAILKAWSSGSEEGLDEKQAAILARCREAMELCVTEGMSDFEKELALHDWMIDQGAYDGSVYDPRTPHGRPDNNNPYGFLVEGWGICLGYAATFQLLMDLAGVECVTVTGAALGSRQDHAWNMVKLDGEWYCVDPTWNDPGDMIPDDPEVAARLYHRYFNVTSDYMRATDHQWDYLNVSEADATRYYWDGRGGLPE